MEPDSDLPLLAAMARRRDEAAFETLFQRHQRAAFGLALSITGAFEHAEEAVQEAMLKAWRAADTFQPREGTTVRSWLLRVVARESLTVLRKGRRERNSKPEVERTLKMGAAVAETGEALETQEALASMRAAMLKLPALDRQLVALAYGAEMSHHEIARELAIPRRTISRRLQDVVNGLRANLKEAGFAAAVPLVSPHELGTAILTAGDPAPGLQAQVMSRLAEAGGEALQAASRRVAAAKTWSTSAVLAAAATGAACVTAGAWLWARAPAPLPSRVEETAPAMEPVRKPEPARASPEAVAEKIDRVWTFEQGPPHDFQVHQGEWRWVAAEPAFPAVMRSDGYVGLEPAVKIPARPFWVSIQYCSTTLKGSQVGGYWMNSRPVERGEERFLAAPPVALGKWREMKLLFSGRHCFVYLEGELFGAATNATPNPADRLHLSFENVSVRRIELHEIPKNEYGPEILDPETFLKETRSKLGTVGGNRIGSKTGFP